jgi:protein-S-isoprenylcysteine O-methyltransferase
MNNLLIFAVSLWFGSERVLLLSKRASAEARDADRSSLRYIWFVIALGNGKGIYLGVKGIGALPMAPAFFYCMGIGLIVLGMAVRWTAIYQLRHFFTVNVALSKDHELIQTGLYRCVRHPSYTGALISFLGLGVAFANPLSTFAISVPIFLVFRFRIAVEETVLLDHFGSTYSDYCARTARLLPGVW